jgi:hypothetical protein
MGQFEPGVQVLAGFGQPVVHLKLCGKLAFLLENRGQGLGGVPGAGLGEFLFYLVEAGLGLGVVKDAPKGIRTVR